MIEIIIFAEFEKIGFQVAHYLEYKNNSNVILRVLFTAALYYKCIRVEGTVNNENFLITQFSIYTKLLTF